MEQKTKPNYALRDSFVFFIPLVVTWNEISTFTAFFQNVVLASPSFDVLTNILTIPSFKKVKAKCYRDHREGFYVYAKPNNRPPNALTKYIGRYLGRPVIAALRIDNYNEKNVTFHYNRHEDEKLIVKTILVMEFIQHFIQHIPEKHFKTNPPLWSLCTNKGTKILIPPFTEKSIKSFCPSTAGVIAYCIPSAMTLSKVLVAVRLWCFWKYMIIISIILWTKCTKG